MTFIRRGSRDSPRVLAPPMGSWNDETGECKPSPVLSKKSSRAPGGAGSTSFEFVLPATQDRVGQDTRTEQQRGRGQENSRATAGRERGSTSGHHRRARVVTRQG